MVCRILTTSAGLDVMSRGIRSRSLSTKLSCKWGKSAIKHLEEQTEAKDYAFILPQAEPQISAKPQSNELEELMVSN